ncbi:hypothetical protein [Jiella avicenniae]|uniref:Uncharacterized protein n=1 Tax=Jiella avicenniae TaxID=2907202 RepID=A0A9X1T6U2_9HYPH|nr:hypothetical protein [Jiella avicenniae]MCE7031016.1 hypothetical protein [Jiella avicenniae]
MNFADHPADEIPLWRAVIVRQLKDATSLNPSYVHAAVAAKIRREARAWLFDDDPDGYFARTCELADFEGKRSVDALRNYVLKFEAENADAIAEQEREEQDAKRARQERAGRIAEQHEAKEGRRIARAAKAERPKAPKPSRLIDGRFRYRKSFEAHGESLTLPQWAERLGVGVETLRRRIRANWPLNAVFTSKTHAGKPWQRRDDHGAGVGRSSPDHRGTGVGPFVQDSA